MCFRYSANAQWYRLRMYSLLLVGYVPRCGPLSCSEPGLQRRANFKVVPECGTAQLAETHLTAGPLTEGTAIDPLSGYLWILCNSAESAMLPMMEVCVCICVCVSHSLSNVCACFTGFRAYMYIYLYRIAGNFSPLSPAN